MPHYYFHIREGAELISDPDGVDLADPDTARDTAIQAARSLLSAAVSEGRLPLRDAIVVEDASGTGVLELTYGEAVGSA